MAENFHTDRTPREVTLYERVTKERLHDVTALDRKITQVFDRLLLEERSLTGFKLTIEKRLGQLWQWQTAAIVLTLVNFALLLWRH